MTNSFLKSYFSYDLPPELIAQTPIEPRDNSRLLCYNRDNNEVKHLRFYNILDLLNSGDVLVINTTRVLAARIFGYDNQNRKFEILLLKRLDINRWEALLKPAKKIKLNGKLTVNNELSLTVDGYGDNGVRIVKFIYNGVFEEILSKVGEMPLPPYITERLTDKERYQTVYSKISGSAAAPTAGLHFTNVLLDKLRKKRVEIAEVLLNVGIGTFRPVKTDNILEHNMHSEYYEVTDKAADIINKATLEGRRVIAVGTTTVRTLESVADKNGILKPQKGDTNIFIYPPYDFKVVKGIITNFHLPESTLIMLVSAFAGRDETIKLYETAVKKRYRFFSFGDAMFID